MYKLRRALLSQNLLHSRKLVNSLLRSSSIGRNDLVLDIGAGKGIITELAAKYSANVIGVEIDPEFYQYLVCRLGGFSNVKLIQTDILNLTLPATPYKVFANLPFAIEGKIIRKLIDAPNPPDDSYVVIMQELAYRLSGFHHENQFTVLHKPWFDFSIFHHFKSSDFTPNSNVDSVMWRFTKRSQPLLPWKSKKSYQRFILTAFGQGQTVLRNLNTRWPTSWLMTSLSNLGISSKAKPGQLALDQWLRLYHCLHKEV